MSVVSNSRTVKFAPRGKESFFDTTKQRVNEYFESANITGNANRKMYIKTAVMLSLYFIPYIFIVTGLGSVNPFVFLGLWAVMGVGVVGIGASVMHDSNHGSYSSNKTVNYLLGNILNLLGGYALNWRIQHNVLHHTYTNLEGLDEDIDPGILLRLSPNKKRLGIHKFQYIYAWFLYSLMNLFWVTVKDYRLLFRYEKKGLLSNQKISLRKGLIELTVLKVFYLFNIIALPIMFSGMPWYYVVYGFLLMHFIGGLSLACIFQPAHVVESSEFPMPKDGKVENNWAVHQLLNTTNFSANSTITSWFIGGLNFQIEHHLFPQICHVHYPAISRIVKKTAAEYGLPYYELPTFAAALYEHGKMLKLLGATDVVTYKVPKVAIA